MSSISQSILAKTLLVIALVALPLTCATVLSSHMLVTSRFETLEINAAKIDCERVVNQLDGLINALVTKVADWAPWDDTYTFVHDRNNDYIVNNLSDASFETLGIDFALFYNSDNRLVHARFHDQIAGTAIPVNTAVVNAVDQAPQLFDHPAADNKVSGLLITPSGPILVAAAPIVTSTFSGPVRGTLVFGCWLDAQKVAKIGEQVRVALQFYPYSSRQDVFSASATETERRFRVVTTDPDTLQAYSLIHDVAGNPAGILAFSNKRVLFHQGLAMWQEHAFALVFSGLLMASILLFLLHRVILRRIKTLRLEVDNITGTRHHDMRVMVAGSDEIGDLACRINAMLKALQNSQQQRDASEQQLKNILDSVNCGIMIVAAENRHIVSINRTGALLIGRPAEEIIGKSCHQFVCPRRHLDCPILDKHEEIDLSERSLLLADGSELPILKSVTWVEWDNQRYLIESFIDIRTLKKAQEEIQANEAKYRRFFEENLTGNFIANKDGQIVDCNPALARMLGYPDEKAVTQIKMADHYFIPDNLNAMLEQLSRKKKLERFEEILHHRNGNPVYCIGNIIGEFDEHGQLERLRGYLFDDTKRVLLEKEIRQAQKLEAIGTVAGGIAHDFNNILAGIMGYAEIGLRDLGEQEHGKNGQHLRKILTAGERARGLIQKILTFSRQTETDLRPIRLQPAVEDVLQLIRASLPTTIAIEPHFHSQATILADQTQIHQVILNLCANAGHAMHDSGGTLTIRIDDVTSAAHPTGNQPQLPPGDYVRLTIADTGKGIPAHLLDRIFDPFFTTKGKGEGTGLGLSMVHGIISSLNGLITVDSQIDKGTTFTLYLRKIDEEEEVALPALLSGLPNGHEHIVFVDDENFLVDIGTQALRGLGYQVTGFTDSTEALNYLLAHGHQVDLVISDITMPKITGLELQQTLQTRLSAPPPVLLCTGYNPGLTKEEVMSRGVRDILLKPITINKLALIVRNILDGNRPTS